MMMIVTLIVASSVCAIAQTRTIEHDYSAFDAIEVSNGFHVTFSQSDDYRAKLVVDDALESYVQCYVKSKTLYILLDDKAIPKDIKKQYKGRNAANPTLNATVYVPVLNSIILNEGTSFSSGQAMQVSDFTLTLGENASASNLNVTAKSASVSVAKKAKLSSMNIKAEDDVTVSGDGNGSVSLEYTAKKLTVNARGSSEMAINGEASGKIEVALDNSPKLTLSGKAPVLKITGKGSAKVDASGLSAEDAVLNFSAADVNVKPSDNLELELGKGASVNYIGNPKVKIVSIQSATVTRK